MMPTRLRLRGFTVDALAGLSKITLKRALSTGVVLLLAALPLIAVAAWSFVLLFGRARRALSGRGYAAAGAVAPESVTTSGPSR